jgi:hypothetical protein
MTDSLSSLTALERVYPVRNPTIPKILNLLAEEGEDMKLMWVPAHTRIEDNEFVDKADKKTLHEEPAPEIRATENDWFKWTKEATKKKERNEWLAPGERMVEIKPNIRKYNDTHNLRRQDQVVVSRIRMGYTRLTEAYRLDNSPQLQWQICQTSISVPHILWECSEYPHQRTQHEIDQGILEENE